MDRQTQEDNNRLIRIIARALVIIWAGFWIFFTTGSQVLGEPEQSFKSSTLISVSVFIALLLTIIIAWKWERLASYLLFLEALAVLFIVVIPAYLNHSFYMLIMSFLLMAGPPIAAGILLLLSSRK